MQIEHPHSSAWNSTYVLFRRLFAVSLCGSQAIVSRPFLFLPGCAIRMYVCVAVLLPALACGLAHYISSHKRKLL